MREIEAEAREARRFDWKAALGATLIAGSVVGGGVLLGKLVLADSRVQVDRADYAAGWTYVVNRQPGARWSDPMAGWACSRYADGFAQLDGVTDAEAFVSGCDDAIAATRLAPEERDEFGPKG